MRETPEDPGQMYDAMKAHAKTIGEWRGAMETKKKTEPTPGPWKEDVAEPGAYCMWPHVYGPEGSGALVFPGDGCPEDDAVLVATVQRPEDVPLVKAAPDLLEAVRFALQVEDTGDAEAWPEAVRGLRRALAKATGAAR